MTRWGSLWRGVGQNSHPTCPLDTLGGFFSPTPLDNHLPTPNVSSGHVGWLPWPTPLHHDTNDHPTCRLDTLGGFLAQLPRQPPTYTQRVILTRWVPFLPYFPPRRRQRPPNVSTRHVGCVFLPLSPSTTTHLTPNVSSRHVGCVFCPLPSTTTHNHPTCHLDTLGVFFAPLPLHDDSPNTQRVISTRWVCFLPLSPPRRPTTTQRVISTRWVGFLPNSPRQRLQRPPNVSFRRVGWLSCPTALHDDVNGLDNHPPTTDGLREGSDGDNGSKRCHVRRLDLW